MNEKISQGEKIENNLLPREDFFSLLLPPLSFFLFFFLSIFENPFLTLGSNLLTYFKLYCPKAQFGHNHATAGFQCTFSNEDGSEVKKGFW